MPTRNELWQTLQHMNITHNLKWPKASKTDILNAIRSVPLLDQPYESDIIINQKKVGRIERYHKTLPNVRIQSHAIPQTFEGRITQNNVDSMYEDIKNFIMDIYDRVRDKTCYYSATLVSFDNEKYNPMAFTENIETLLEQLKEYLLKLAQNYDTGFGVTGAKITEVEFLYMKDIGPLIKATKNAINDGNDLWYVIDSPTIENCVFVSIVTAKSWKNNHDLLHNKDTRIRRAIKLKQNLKDEGYSFPEVEYETLDEIADAMGINLVVYNDCYDITKTINQSFETETVNIMICDNVHAKAMIKRCDITEIISDFDFPIIGYKTTNYEEKPIFGKKCEETLDEKIVSWDIETYLEDQEKGQKLGSDKNYVVYASGLAYMVDGELKEHYVFDDEMNLKQLFNYIFQNIDTFKDHTFYAHNGGRFDLVFLLRDVLIDNKNVVISESKLLELNSSIIGMTIMYKGHKIHFKDSLRMFTVSLKKITKDFNVASQKGDIDHRSINRYTFGDKAEEIMKYLKNDVRGLLEVLTIHNKNVFEQFKINITSCYTSASLSKNIYNTCYSYIPENKKNFRIQRPSKEIEDFIRPNFHGGRCEAFQLGPVDKPQYLDFTSLYPSQGRLPLPTGTALKVDITTNIEDFMDNLENSHYGEYTMGFVKVMVKGTEENLNYKKPMHSIKMDGKLLFPYIENWREETFFSEEIRYGLSLGYKYKPIEAVLYRRMNLMKRLFEDCFKYKQEATENGETAKAAMWKIILNSAYGFWGFNPNGKTTMKLYKNGGWKTALAKGIYIRGKQYDNGHVFATVKSDAIPTGVNVGIASAIASYSRMKLHQLILELEKVGKVYYCDTDSVITNVVLSDHPHLMKMFRPDGDGKSLGSLKNELNADKKKKSNLDIAEDLHFDRACIVGCKMYNLMADGEPWSSKLKGFKDVDNVGEKISLQESYDNIEKLYRNETIYQTQMQILGNRNDYSTNGFNLRYTENEGNPKQFKMNYTKGYVVEDIVYPLSI
jgi:hypothetical protein